ncbi:MAG TPA: thioredoxin domain-containing protein [Chloroflexota bacterium]|nr:thioredoxin domain-containing protein [Chloroflexota bacterium]
MPNRLANETSPYLLQHKDNPVDWYPWGEEALARARAEDKPILLSIGYSACHWCHVMERESFENPEIARLMNELFINIKVDREERPDLDHLYMTAVQLMTRHGGWPLTVFLLPDGTPFYGGTYFPPEDRGQLPGFPRVLQAVAEAYRTRRAELAEQGARLREAVQQLMGPPPADAALDPALLDQAVRNLAPQFDPAFGGFGGAPKFPQPMLLEFLLRRWLATGDAQALHMVEFTLEQMANGGIYDQIGGGFHRYAVDRYWLVPHFEKMLYDNAQLSRVYLHAYAATGKPGYRRIAEEIYAYVQREMTAPAGGFYATQDADSEGEEGKFYLWTPAELRAVLGDDAPLLERYWGVTEQGNFEGKNILHVPRPAENVARELGVSVEELDAAIERAVPKLYAARARRAWPARDEKILTAWNGLMLRSLAEAARLLDEPQYRELAVRNAEFVLGHLRRDGRLLRSYKDGQARLAGYLEDYACYAAGLLALYEATFDLRWFVAARELADTLLDLFWDDPIGGFYSTPRDHEPLPVRPRDYQDNATPAGSSVAVQVLLQLALLTGEQAYAARAERVLRSLAPHLAQYPLAFGEILCALDFHLAGPYEIALVGEPDAEDTADLLDVIYGTFLPNKVVALRRPGDVASAAAIALLANREAIGGRATAYVCRHFACEQPTTDPAELARQLGLPAPEPTAPG